MPLTVVGCLPRYHGGLITTNSTFLLALITLHTGSHHQVSVHSHIQCCVLNSAALCRYQQRSSLSGMIIYPHLRMSENTFTALDLPVEHHSTTPTCSVNMSFQDFGIFIFYVKMNCTMLDKDLGAHVTVFYCPQGSCAERVSTEN